MGLNITAEDIEKVDNIRLKLLDCTDKGGVEKVFSDNGLSADYAAKTEFLFRCMQVKKIYLSSDDKEQASEKEIYEFYLDFFLEGKWKPLV